MMNSILTNKVIFHRSYDDLDKTYDIVYIKTSKTRFKFNSIVFDLPMSEKNVKSILHSNGKIYLLLKKNDNNIENVMTSLENVPEKEYITAEYLKSSNVEDPTLLQLLLNSIWSYDLDELRFNNLTGHLFVFAGDWCVRGKRELKNEIVKVSCLEVKVDKQMHINLNVKTFSSGKMKEFIRFGKTKYEDYPKYVLNVNGTLTRKLKGSKETEYIMRSFGRKREIAFLDLSSYLNFKKTKMGVLVQVIQRFNKVFGESASIELENIPLLTVTASKRGEVNKDNGCIISEFLNKNINIVDLANDEESKEAITKVINELEETFKASNISVGNIDDKALNILMLHQKDYYEADDPYLKQYQRSVSQHLCIEELQGRISHIIRTCINELLIKKDLLDHRISLYDWQKLNNSGTTKFISKFSSDNENVYCIMEVDQKGFFTMSQFDEFASDCKNLKYLDYFMYDDSINNLLIDQRGNVIALYDTGWVTIPNIFGIDEYLKNGNNKLKGKEKRAELLEAVTDIRTFEKDNETYYYVGVIGDGMQSVVNNASHIRKINILQKGSDIDLVSITNMMNNQFVRNGQYTVLPFPFKYIREYMSDVPIEIEK